MNTIPKIQDKSKLAGIILDCQKRGFSYLPITINDKQPYFSLLPKVNRKYSWAPFQHQYPSNEQSLIWAATSEGIAVVTGAISGIVVLDVDSYEPGGAVSIKGKSLPITPTARSQHGGAHYYYKHPGIRIPSKRGFLQNVDIRADGGYIVYPGNIGYEWCDGLSIDDVEPAEMPEWLIDLLYKPKESNSETVQSLYKKNKNISLLCTDLPEKTGDGGAKLMKPFEAGSLRLWYQRKDVIERLLTLLEIPEQIGKAFKCVLPGHTDKNASASVHAGNNGVYVYRDWHKQDEKEFYMLSEVYAFKFYGKVVKLTDSEIATWGIRLLVDSGLIQPEKVEHRQIGKVKKSVQKVYQGFIHLLGCKWLYSPGEPTAFSRKFARAWCGVGEQQAREAILLLLENGYIRIEDQYKAGSRDVKLYKINDT